MQKLLNKPARLSMMTVTFVQQTGDQLRSLAELNVNEKGKSPPPVLQALLDKCSSIFSIPSDLPRYRDHDHKIVLKEGTSPVNVRPYRYSSSQKDKIEKMIQELLQTGVIRHSLSPYSSPIVMVKKKDGSWRMCIDYRELNRATVKDKFPIPVIEELLDELGNAKLFSKLDLRSGYHQIRMCSDDIEKIAFRSHHGHYEFVVIPFGLTNAPSTFQSLMNHIFQSYLRKFILVFFDDILIYSPSWSVHLCHLETAFQVLKTHRLLVKMSKYSFGETKVEYLGHIIGQGSVSADPKKLEAMVQWLCPKTLKELRGFLGLTGYYRKFIRGYGMIARPLYDLLKKGTYHWNEKAEQAFCALKNVMTTSGVSATQLF